LKGPRSRHFDDEPVFLGEIDIDGHAVALYFASRMSHERAYAKVDAALRLRPRPVAGVVLTTTSTPLPFAGTNVVIPIEDVLADAGNGSAIDLDRLKVAYRHGQLAAMGGSTVTLKVAPMVTRRRCTFRARRRGGSRAKQGSPSCSGWWRPGPQERPTSTRRR